MYSRLFLLLFIPLTSRSCLIFVSFFFFNDPATTEIYTLSLPTLFRSLQLLSVFVVSTGWVRARTSVRVERITRTWRPSRSEEHTSELQSRRDLVCRLLLEKKKKKKYK